MSHEQGCIDAACNKRNESKGCVETACQAQVKYKNRKEEKKLNMRKNITRSMFLDLTSVAKS